MAILPFEKPWIAAFRRDLRGAFDGAPRPFGRARLSVRGARWWRATRRLTPGDAVAMCPPVRATGILFAPDKS